MYLSPAIWARLVDTLMEFCDPKLQHHVDRVASLMTGLPDDQRPICGLLDAYYWFNLVEGEQSPRAAEALRLLLSPELRPALRNWYRRFGETMNPSALEFRARLSTLAGENFG